MHLFKGDLESGLTPETTETLTLTQTAGEWYHYYFSRGPIEVEGGSIYTFVLTIPPFTDTVHSGYRITTPPSGPYPGGHNYAIFNEDFTDHQRWDDADLAFQIWMAVNQPPTLATNAGLTVNEGASGTITSTNLRVTDPDGDTVTFTLGTAPVRGQLRGSGTPLSAGDTFTQDDIDAGLITYVHDDSETTSDSFTFTVSDGNGGSLASTTFSITINPVNDPPTFNLGADVTVPEDYGPTSIANFLTDSSPGEPGQTLTITVSNNNNALFSAQPAINGSGTLTFTPAPNAYGEAEVTVTVRDDGGTAHGGIDTTTKTFMINVTAVNDPPSFTPGPNVTVAEDAGPQTRANWATDITAGPLEPDQTVTFEVTQQSGAALFSMEPAISPIGTLTFTPAPDANGFADFSVLARDSEGAASIARTFRITIVAVNDPPIANPDVDFGTSEDSGEIRILADLLANDKPGPDTATDEVDQTLTIISVANGTGGTVRMDDGGIYFTPAVDFHGNATFTYTVRDSEGATAIGTVTVPVSPVADTPAAIGATTPEDTQTTSGLVLSRNAVDGAEVTHFLITGIMNGTLYLNDGTTEIQNNDYITFAQGNAGLRFTPGADLYSPATTFGFTVAAATSATGSGLSDSVFVPITVTAVNDPPTAVDDTLADVAEDSIPIIIPFTDLTDNDSTGPANESDQTLTVIAVSDPVGGTLSLDTENNQIIFTLTEHFNGTAGFTYTVRDSGAAPNTDTATVRFTVWEVNDPPEPVDDTLSAVDEDSAPRHIAIASLLANDRTGPLGVIDELDQALTLVSVGSPVGGTVKVQGAEIIFTLTPDFYGTASFIYTVRDNGATNGQADPKEASATVSFTVNPTAEAPIVTGTTTAEDTQSTDGLEITPDPADGAGVTHFRISGITGGWLYQNNGTTPINNGDFITAAQGAAGLKFTPTPDRNSLDGASFRFTIQAAFDGAGAGLGPGTTASIWVYEVNDEPTAVDDAIADSPEDTVYIILAAALLANDSTGPANESGQTLTITAVDSAMHGTVAINEDGNVVFTPNENYYGPASFRYTVTDNGTTNGTDDLKGDTATVRFTITPVPDAPSITADPTDEDTPATVVIKPHVADLTGVTHFVLTGVTGGIIYVGGTPIAIGDRITLAEGLAGVTFAPEPDKNSVDDGADYFTVSFRAHDSGRTLTGDATTVTIRVNEVNDAPTAVAEQLAAVDEDAEPFTIAAAILLLNDVAGPSNESGQTLTITAVTPIGGGTVTLDIQTQIITFTLEPDFFGDAGFHYTVTDNGTTNGSPDPKTATAFVRIPVNPVVDTPSVDSITTAEDTQSGLITITRHPKDTEEVTHYLITEITSGTLYQADGITSVGNGSSITYAQGSAGLRFRPAADLNTPAGDTFSFKVQAHSATGAGTSAAVTATITVTEVNDPPIGVDDTLVGTYLEDDGPYLIPFADLTDNDLPGGLNEEHQDLTVHSVGGAVGGTVTIVGTDIRFLPDADYNGTASFTYFVRDNGTTNGAADPKTSAAPATVTFTITPVNDPPSFTKGADVTALEDAGPQTVTGWATNISAGPANERGQELTFILTTNNDSLFATPPAIDADTGTLTYTSAPDANGSATVIVTLRDDGGTANGGVDRSAEQSFTITITPVNDAPVAQDLVRTVIVGNSITGQVTASDVDGDPLTYSLVTAPTKGTVTMNTNGTFTYRATATGTDRFTFVANDGALDSNEGTVTITVQSVPPSPKPIVLVLTITAPELVTTAESIRVSGTANPYYYIAVQGTILQADGQGNWSLTAPLAEGPNVITASNGNLTKSITVVRVREPEPEAPIVDELPALVRTPELTVTGSGFPESEVTLLVNGQATATAMTGQDGRFTFEVELAEGSSLIAVQGVGELRSREQSVQYEPERYTDIGEHWARAAIVELAELGIASIYEGPLFGPEERVTRLEFAVMVARVLGLSPVDEAPPFTDTDAMAVWARPEVSAAVEAGIIRGMPDGSFAPNALVTRAEMAVMLARALDYAGFDITPGERRFSDQAEIPDWAEEQVLVAAGYGLITGYPDGSFQSGNSTTRAEAVTMLKRLLDLLAVEE